MTGDCGFRHLQPAAGSANFQRRFCLRPNYTCCQAFFPQENANVNKILDNDTDGKFRCSVYRNGYFVGLWRLRLRFSRSYFSASASISAFGTKSSRRVNSSNRSRAFSGSPSSLGRAGSGCFIFSLSCASRAPLFYCSGRLPPVNSSYVSLLPVTCLTVRMNLSASFTFRSLNLKACSSR